MLKSVAILVLVVSLTACSQRDHGGGSGAVDTQSAKPASAPARIAYSYSFRFSVPDTAVAAAQSRHVAMCDRLGLERCRVLESHQSTGEYGGASLKLEVASDLARRFGASLAAPLAPLGGTQVSNDVAAEDIGRQIVDVEARLQAKRILVERLRAALKTRPGSAADLVAIEKAVSDAQGELDAAQSELNLAQRRVAMSPVAIDYDQRRSFSSKLREAFSDVGETVSSSVAALIYFVAAVLPWAIVGVICAIALRAGWRRLKRKRVGA